MKKIIIVLIVVFCTGLCVRGQSNITDFYDEVLAEQNKGGSEYISRSEFVAVLMKTLGYTEDIFVCSFYDVYNHDWEYKYIANAERRKIVSGDYWGAFMPDNSITVGDAVTVISRAYKVTDNYSDTFAVMGVRDYSKAYIQYSCRLGLYPKKNNTYLDASEPLRVADAISLINGYEGLTKEELSYLEIVEGYPKMTESGKSSAIRVNLKTTKPCTVYYKIIDATNDVNVITPKKEDISTLFARITDASCEVSGLIPIDFNKVYKIYFIAKDEKGFVSEIRSLTDVRPFPYVAGKGTAQNPYKIYTKYQLEQIRNYPDKHFILCADIEYNGEWEPIGNSQIQSEMFCGVLDGQGYSITGLKINGKQETGFISCLFGGTIRNLNIDAEVLGNSYVGVIAGKSEGGTIENCHVTGSVSAKGNISGGIVGKNNGVINSCVSAVYYVESAAYSGGIAGHNTGIIAECISAVEKIRADMYACAIAGVNVDGVIKSSVAAVMEISNIYSGKTGRITTNRDMGRTVGNYSYAGMIARTNVNYGADTQDGIEVSWQELINEGFYTDILKWDFKNKWTLEKKPLFMLPTIKDVHLTGITRGKTVYSPEIITDWKQLQNMKLSSHYILGNDIYLPKTYGNSNWTPIGMTESDNAIDGGFIGTLDGNGYRVSGIRLYFDEDILQYGLFGKLTGATVRNLKIVDSYIEGNNKAGILTAINYGIVENCSVFGEIKVNKNAGSTLAGGICAANYTNILSSNAEVDIDINVVSATTGGISAHNEGFINECAYRGEILSRSVTNTSNSIIGGVVGANYSGYVYNCFAEADIRAMSYTNYCGGIVGLQFEGEIYKCSSMGQQHLLSQQIMPSNTYSGGICGLISGGLIMNSFTQSDISVKADKGYCGGIAGYGENASIQNTYSLNSINQIGKIYRLGSAAVYSGGIAGYCENVNISSNAAINPYILTNGYYAPVCAYSSGGYVSDNFYSDELYSEAELTKESVVGEKIGFEKLCEPGFYFKTASEGGRMNWTDNPKDRVWKSGFDKKYPFPTLYDVANQGRFEILYKY